jgi:hypothetical protein
MQGVIVLIDPPSLVIVEDSRWSCFEAFDAGFNLINRVDIKENIKR